jgi:ribonuclease HI
MGKRILVTLFTDASVYPNGVGGYGYWAIKDGEKTEGGGQFRAVISNSDEGEACAVANSIAVLVKSGFIAEDHHVLIQTDSTGTIQAFESKRPILPRMVKKAVSHVVGLAQEVGFSFNMRHVKGHTGKRGRHWCNDKTDRIARRFANNGRRTSSANQE